MLKTSRLLRTPHRKLLVAGAVAMLISAPVTASAAKSDGVIRATDPACGVAAMKKTPVKTVPGQAARVSNNVGSQANASEVTLDAQSIVDMSGIHAMLQNLSASGQLDASQQAQVEKAMQIFSDPDFVNKAIASRSSGASTVDKPVVPTTDGKKLDAGTKTKKSETAQPDLKTGDSEPTTDQVVPESNVSGSGLGDDCDPMTGSGISGSPITKDVANAGTSTKVSKTTKNGGETDGLAAVHSVNRSTR